VLTALFFLMNISQPNPSVTERTTSYEIELLRTHKNNPNSEVGARALDELLKKHSAIIAQAAANFSKRYPHIGTYDDFLQEATLAALVAYSRNDEEKSHSGGIRLYLRSIIFRELLSYVSDAGFVRINSHNRAVKNYVTGKYDHLPEKLDAFEERHNLHNARDREEFKRKYRMFTMQIYSWDSLVIRADSPGSVQDLGKVRSSNYLAESKLLRSLDIRNCIENLSDIHRELIVAVYVREEDIETVANRLEISVGSAKYALQKAKKELEAMMA
jgi:RNA polymerase sigma factor (sigma-70 family)